jgi:cephalosporin hydroxylase
MTDAPTSHGTAVPDAETFEAQRAERRSRLAADEGLRRSAVDLQVAAEEHGYTYTWEWLGVPVIRVPDDICVLQELVWDYRPDRIVETGVARGGSMVLNASLQRLAGLEPHVLGLDIMILPHTRDALADHPMAVGVELYEGDSTDELAQGRVVQFVGDAERTMLVLDSNHTHDHVLAELRVLAPLLPVGSYVLVADTLIEEFPRGHYADRPWDRGNNPLTAVRQFLAENPDYELDGRWARRGLLSEFRDGIIRRVG